MPLPPALFIAHEGREARRSRLAWQEAEPQLLRPSGNLDLVVSSWSKNPSTAPSYVRVVLGDSQTGGSLLCCPLRLGGPGATGFSFANEVKCHPAGLMGELNEVMLVGQSILVTLEGLWWQVGLDGSPALPPLTCGCLFRPLLSLHFSFLNCKMRIITPTLQGSCE